MRSDLYAFTFFFAFVWLGFAALASAQDNAQIKIGGGTIDISFDTAPTEDLRKLVIDWIATAARSVSTYYTKFPVPHVAIARRFP